MKAGKTTILRFKPIAEITDDEMKEEVLATDCNGNWMQGSLRFLKKPILGVIGFACIDSRTNILGDIKHYAVLPKDE